MAESTGIGKGFAAGKTAQEQVDMLRKLLSPLKGRAIVNADKMAFKNALSNPSSGKGFAAGKTAQEQVDMLRKLLSPLEGRAIVNADEMAFKNALSNPSSGGGTGGTSLNLNTDSGARFKKGGKVSSASKRADGCAVRGKTRA